MSHMSMNAGWPPRERVLGGNRYVPFLVKGYDVVFDLEEKMFSNHDFLCWKQYTK
jgi:hypothetical protein